MRMRRACAICCREKCVRTMAKSCGKWRKLCRKQRTGSSTTGRAGEVEEDEEEEEAEDDEEEKGGGKMEEEESINIGIFQDWLLLIYF